MDISDLYDDEVIADSEEEDNGHELELGRDEGQHQSEHSVRMSFSDTLDSGEIGVSNKTPVLEQSSANLASILPLVSPPRGDAQPQYSHADASIPPSSPKSRPRPRPLWNKNKNHTRTSSPHDIPPQGRNLDVQPDTTFFSGTGLSSATSNIADRAKMRSRNTKSKTADFINPTPSSSGQRSRSKSASMPFSDIIVLTSDEDDELSLLPASKSLPKRKAQVKTDSKPKAEVSSDPKAQYTVTPDSIPKPRPRPKPRPKGNKRSKVLHPTSPQTHEGSTSQGSLPLPSSPMHSLPLPIPFGLLSSQLPPSDPPSTATTYDLPHIETLPNLDTEIDVPVSSPSSLFSVYEPGQRKRKRAPSGVDELDSDRDAYGDMDMDIDARMMPPPPLPPPTFFAGSSPPPVDVDSRPPTNPHAEVVDLSIIPSTADTNVTTVKPVRRATKPGKPRKKKGRGQDEDDDDFELSKAKHRIKGKEKEKKPPRKKMNVVVEGIKIRKENGREENGEVFKSREYIGGGVVGEDEVLKTMRGNSPGLTKPDSRTSLSSVPDSENEDQRRMVSSKEQEAVEEDEDDQLARSKSRAERESYLKGVSKPAKRTKARGRGRGKDKAVVLSEDQGEDMEDVATDSPPETNAAQANGKVKAKRTRYDNAGMGREAIPDVVGDSVDQSESGVDDNEQIRGEEGDTTGPSLKENIQPVSGPSLHTPRSSKTIAESEKVLFPSLSSRYSIAPKTKSTPMSELIRRVNSLPGSPFPSPHPRASTSSSLRPSTPGTAYSPYLKSSRSILSRIAPLHPNRRTPPPPLPPPPPPKKTKKEREREEQWEEELVESVGGITEWACMTDGERKELRKVKWEREMGGWEE